MSPEGLRPVRSRFERGLQRQWKGINSRSAVGRALRMAQAIQARSAGLMRRGANLPMTILNRAVPPQAAPGGPIRLEVNVSLQLPPRAGVPALRSDLGRVPVSGTAASASAPGSPVRPLDRPLMELAHPTLPASSARSQPSLQTILQRIVEQHERIETALRYPLDSQPPSGPAFSSPAAKLAQTPPTGLELQPPPVRQVVRRAASANAGVGEQTPPNSTRTSSASPESPPALSQPAAPALDVNRLTDQVIQAIDRRIIANRERLGRI